VTAAPTKLQLRTEYLGARRALTAEFITRARGEVRAQVLAGPLPSTGTIAAYEPLRTEPGSLELNAALIERGLRVLVPRVLSDNDLDWVDWADPSTPLGPSAIAAASLVLVPALAVACSGTRLGRGGGSYDRALTRVRPGGAVVALVYEHELVDELPRDPWDRPVNAAVSPRGWHVLGNTGWTGNAVIPHHG
jgi:5-formyltetrahydrofolate cyclo-ligase